MTSKKSPKAVSVDNILAIWYAIPSWRYGDSYRLAKRYGIDQSSVSFTCKMLERYRHGYRSNRSTYQEAWRRYTANQAPANHPTPSPTPTPPPVAANPIDTLLVQMEATRASLDDLTQKLISIAVAQLMAAERSQFAQKAQVYEQKIAELEEVVAAAKKSNWGANIKRSLLGELSHG